MINITKEYKTRDGRTVELTDGNSESVEGIIFHRTHAEIVFGEWYAHNGRSYDGRIEKDLVL